MGSVVGFSLSSDVILGRFAPMVFGVRLRSILTFGEGQTPIYFSGQQLVAQAT